MKNIKVVALLLAAIMVFSVVFVSCSSDNDKSNQTTTPKKTGNILPEQPENPPDNELPPPPDPETPVTGDEFEAWHNSKTAVTILEVTSDDLTPYGEGESFDKLFDGEDGFLTSSSTKLGGRTTTGNVTLVVTCPASTKLGAYAFVTGNDSGSYQRTPGAWILYGTNTDPATATDADWKVLDDVKNGATEDVNLTPYGYTIDAANQAEYTYYKIVFSIGAGLTYGLTELQLSELYLYAA